MMKKLGTLMFMILFLFALPGTMRAAAAETSIYLDGEPLVQPAQTKAGVIKGSVMVPIRVIVEGLGYDVGWEKESGKVTIKQGTTTLELKIDERNAMIDGQSVALAAPPLLQNGITLVPLRFVSEQMGMKVSWNNDSKSAYLYSPKGDYSKEVISGEYQAAPDQPSGQKSTVSKPASSPEYIPDTVGKSETVSGGNETGQAGENTQNLTEPVRVGGISFNNNQLIIATSTRVEAKVHTLPGPDRLVVDIPNADFAEQFGDNAPLDLLKKNGKFAVTEYPGVKEVRYSLFTNDPSVRIVVELTQSMSYSVSNAGDNLIIIDLSQTLPNAPVPVPIPVIPANQDGRNIVVFDAGHGGKQPGAIGITGKQEKDFTLAVALKVEQLLKNEKDIELILTRSTDVTMTLQDRVKVANNANADLFVSIHANSIDSKSSNPSGSETYYTRDVSIPLANIMHKHLVQATGLADRKVRQSSLHVTRETKMPAVLLEAGYMSNSKDEALMYTEEFQQDVAEGIVAGIKEYLGLK